MAEIIERFGYSEKIRRLYTQGNCWMLSSSLFHDFDVRPILVTFGKDYDQIENWNHAANISASGLVVDVIGIWRVSEWQKDWWGGYVFTPRWPIDDSEYWLCTCDAEMHGCPDCLDPDWDHCNEIAYDVYKRFEIFHTERGMRL